MASTTIHNNNKAVKNYRISKSVWYASDYNDVTKRLTTFMEQATGYDMKSSELFQVINYGLGGRFDGHEDYLLTDKVCLNFRKNIKSLFINLILFYLIQNQTRFNGTSDRIATTLFYVGKSFINCLFKFHKYFVYFS